MRAFKSVARIPNAVDERKVVKRANQFDKLPLAAQAYVKSEVEKRLAMAVDVLKTESRALERKSSLQSWIRYAVGSFFAIGLALFTYLVAPDRVRDYIITRVDEKVTVPEINNAAERVLSDKLDILAEEKITPFEKRAEELHVSLSNSENRVAAIEKELIGFSDIRLARMYNREAFQRIVNRSRGDDSYSRLCQMEVKSIREQLLLERSATDYLVISEQGIDGKVFTGPFTDDEIYDRYVAERKDPLGSINAMRSRHCKCFDLILLDVASKCSNLKTAESALAFLEKLGAPHTDVWHLSNVSNWVEKVIVTEMQFPQKDYDIVRAKLMHEGLHEARQEMVSVLDKFKPLEKLRTIAIVEALSRRDLSAAKGLYQGYVDRNTRWRKVSDCYFMSVTGSVEIATQKLIECSKQYSSLIIQLDNRPWWMIQQFFDLQKLRDWVTSEQVWQKN